MTGLNSISKSTGEAPHLESSYLGPMDYQRSVNLQRDLLEKARVSRGHYLIGLEHPAVLTLGYRAREAEEIYNSQEPGLPVVFTARGGLATIHSEGQLVIYPVLNLRELGLGARDYVCLLLRTTRKLLANLGIASTMDEQVVGLYTARGKIAFCGIQITNGVSQHGLSLNVRNDLSLFSRIRACGVENPRFDSLANHGVSFTLAELYSQWAEIFKAELNQLQ